MLLFIERTDVEETNDPLYFNTSHVTVYLHIELKKIDKDTYFNTSHVTVYLFKSPFMCYNFLFQYISCYCLSKRKPIIEHWSSGFQYISCYCLSSSVTPVAPSANAISIHLMLLFIHILLLLSTGLRNFNTSHVTVYRCGDKIQWIYHLFQYISCYCLSCLFLNGMWHIWTFQYISCYCLSRTSCYTRRNILISIHLMLLFI